MAEKKINVKMNEKRNAILNVLANASEPMTLAEIAKALGEDKIATGTTNAMVTAGLMKKVGEKEITVMVKKKITTYAIGDGYIADDKTTESK